MLRIKRVPTVVSNYQEEGSVVSIGCGSNCFRDCCLPGSKLPLYAFWKSDEKVDEKELPFAFLESFLLGEVKKLMPQSKFTREFFAVFTTLAFRWLVGPCEVRESEFEGRNERNVVHITKCRFLEEANCIGMCTNLCKMPTQEFISKNFGTPVNMVPNFDDMSCEIIFGQDPPAQETMLQTM